MIFMGFPEETSMREFHREVFRRFADSAPPTESSFHPCGLNSACDVARNGHSCHIYCHGDPPEYYVQFKLDLRDIARGQTKSRDEAMAAIGLWLDKAPLELLYAKFAFVDQRRRTYLRMREQLHALVPKLGMFSPGEITERFGDAGALCFRTPDRGCEILIDGYDPLPDARFYWDDCGLFRFRISDLNRLAEVLSCWLCENAMPFQMRQRFPDLDIDETADYYERGEGIVGEFVRSWKRMKRFHREIGSAVADQVQGLITEIQNRGYDRTLRAGQSMGRLVVSRSRRHGMRNDQPRITFSFLFQGMQVDPQFDGLKTLSFPRIEFAPEVDALLKALQSKPIT